MSAITLTRGIEEGRRGAAGLFVLGTFLFWASVYTYVPILPAYVERVSGSLRVVAWVVGAYGFTQLALRVPLGVWSDRASTRKPFVVAGLLAAIVSGLGLAFSDRVASLIVFRGLAGVAAATWAVFTVLFSDSFTPADPRRAMTIMQVASGVGQIAAALLGGWVAAAWGWTAPFYAGALLAVLGVACVAAVPEPAVRAPARQRASAATVVRIAGLRKVMGASIVAALAQCGFWATVNGFTPIYAVRLGATAEVLGLLAMVTLVPYTVAPILADMPWSRRVHPGLVVAVGCLLVAAATLAVPFIGSLAVLMLAQAVGGVGRGLIFPVLMTCTLEAVGVRERGTAMGLFQATYALGMTAGPWLAAWLVVPLGLAGVFITMAFLTTLAGILALAVLD